MSKNKKHGEKGVKIVKASTPTHQCYIPKELMSSKILYYMSKKMPKHLNNKSK